MQRGEIVQNTVWLCQAGAQRASVAIALLFAVVFSAEAGSDAPATKQQEKEQPSIPFEMPVDLGPADESPDWAPVSSLPAIQSLDLTRSPVTLAKVAPVKVAERTDLAPLQLESSKTTLTLVAPSNETSEQPIEKKSPKPDAAKPFQPEWRPARKAQPSKSVTLPLTEPEARPLQRPEAGEKPQPAKSAPAKTQVEKKVSPKSPTTKPPVAKPQVKQQEAKKPLKPLTREQLQLRNRLRKVVSYYYQKPLNSRDHDAWEAMHGMLAYGLKSRIRTGSPNGKPTSAVGWLCYNNPCKRKQLMRLNDEGEIRAQYGVGLQGHMGQFLAMLAQCNVDPTYPIRVSGKEFTIEDLIASEQETCYPKTELTFKLIGLMHYLPSDATWVNDRGENWSIERLIEEEMSQPIRGVACGGTHRLGGLSLAVRTRAQRGEPIDGAFAKAAQFTKRYEQYAFHLQNPDGSFSTEWFRGPGRESDINRRVRTSGHLLEWILYQIPDEKLESYRVVKGVNYLTNLLYQNTRNEWEVGPISHAIHALILYDQRMFRPHDPPKQLAGGAKSNTKSRATSSHRQRSTTARQPTRYRGR